MSGHGLAHRVYIGGAGFLYRLRPHVHAHVGGLHGVVGDALVAAGQIVFLYIVLPLLDEGLVLRILDGHEIIPRGQLAHQRFGIDTAQLLFAHGERHHRNLGGLDALVPELFIKRYVGIAIDGGDHRGLATGGELLDVGHDRLIIRMAERGVDLLDVLVGNALGMQERAQNLIGGTRINIVGAEQEVAFGTTAVLAHEVLDRGDGLLVGRRAGVEHVLRKLLAFVLHRIEQQAVEFFVYRQHRLTRHRRPATEGGRHLVLADELARLFRKQRPVRRRIDHHRLEFLAQEAALGVDFFYRHERHIFQRGFADGHGAGEGVEYAYFNSVRCLYRGGRR